MPRVLITRSPHQASELADQLRAAGLDPVMIPTIELTDPTTFTALDAALTNLPNFHWLIFSSANAVEAFAKRRAASLATTTHPSTALLGTGFSPSINAPKASEASAPEANSQDTPPPSYLLLPASCRIAAIGPATARALQSHGLTVILTPPQAVAESLAQSLLPNALQPDNTPTRFLLIRAEQARDHLPDTLRAAGAEVTIAPAYRTIVPATSIAAIRDLFTNPANYPDAITFTSSSTATNLLALLEASSLTLPPQIPRISIGPITTQTLRDLNLPPQAESPVPTIPSLAATIVRTLGAITPVPESS